MLISVDAGKDMTKACIKNDDGKWITEKFRSRIYDFKEGEVQADQSDLTTTYKVELGNDTYLVGDAGTKQEYTTSKTDIVNKLCQYVAITRFIEPGKKTKLSLVTGCPASIYKNTNLRKEYIRNIKGDGTVQVTVDDMIYRFEFENIFVRPEGSGITMLKPHWFIDRNTIAFDIGGQNLNITVFDNVAIDPDRMLTKNAGGITIEQNLINTFETYGIDNITNNVIRTAIMNKQLKNNTISLDKTNEIIRDEINRYIENNIIEELNKNSINHEIYSKVFIGGTSHMIKDYLLEYFDDAEFMDNMEKSQFANAKGFYDMLQGDE